MCAQCIKKMGKLAHNDYKINLNCCQILIDVEILKEVLSENEFK